MAEKVNKGPAVTVPVEPSPSLNNAIFPTGVGGFFKDLGVALSRQADIDAKLATTRVIENQRIAEDAVRYTQSANQSMEQLNTIKAQGEEARRIADSGNIFERITLLGDQALNPQAATREGRQKRAAEINQVLAIEGQILGAKGAAADVRLQSATAEHALETLTINKGITTQKGLIEGAMIAQQGMQASENMRLLNLSKVELPTLTATMAGPEAAPGKYMVGGFEYSAVELRERTKSLEAREKLSYLTPQQTDPDYAAKLGVAHEMQLSTMGSAELEELRANGFIMKDGTQVMPGIWNNAWTSANLIEQQSLQRKMNEHMLQNQVPTMLEQGQSLLQTTATFVQPGTPLGAARSEYTAALAAAAEFAKTDTTPTGKMTQIAMLEKAQQRYFQSMGKEADSKAGGDEGLKNIYLKQMTGQPVAPEEIGDVLRKRYIKRDGFGTILDQEMSNRVRLRADKIVQEKMKANAQQDMYGSAPKMSEAETREQAFNESFQIERSSIGVDAINTIQKGIIGRTDSPAAKNGMIPLQIEQIQNNAQLEGFKRAQSQFNLSDEQMLYLKQGNFEAAKLPPNQAAMILTEINQASTIAEYEMYEQKRVGLGSEMMEWYSKTIGAMAPVYESNIDPMKRALAGDSVQTEAQKAAMVYMSADEAVSKRRQMQVTEMSVGVKRPENAWLMMLQMNDRMADSQKQSLYYDVVMPAIQQVRAAGGSDEQASAAAFQALNNFESSDKSMEQAVKVFNKDLPKTIDSFENTFAAAILMGQPNRIAGQRAYNDPNAANMRLKAVIPWVK